MRVKWIPSILRYSLTCPHEPTTHTKCNVVNILTNKTLQRWKTEYSTYFDIFADTVIVIETITTSNALIKKERGRLKGKTVYLRYEVLQIMRVAALWGRWGRERRGCCSRQDWCPPLHRNAKTPTLWTKFASAILV